MITARRRARTDRPIVRQVTFFWTCRYRQAANTACLHRKQVNDYEKQIPVFSFIEPDLERLSAGGLPTDGNPWRTGPCREHAAERALCHAGVGGGHQPGHASAGLGDALHRSESRIWQKMMPVRIKRKKPRPIYNNF